MDHAPDSGLARDFAAAMDWWNEAGLDCLYNDAPTRWIAPPAPAEAKAPDKLAPIARPPAASAGEPAAPPVDRGAWPKDLSAFAEWWMTEPWLDGGRTAGRVPPRGKSGARLMVVVPEPEREDSDQLLCGPQGRLLAAMLGAMGIPREDVYAASVLPRHTPMADWAAVARQGIGDVLAHHIQLVAPERILAFGGNILALFGNDLPNSAAVSRKFNHEGLSVPLLSAMDLAALLARPRAKARLWQMWLEWTGIGTE